MGLITLAAGILAGTVVTRTGVYSDMREKIAPTEPGLGLDDAIDSIAIAAVVLGLIMLVKRLK